MTKELTHRNRLPVWGLLALSYLYVWQNLVCDVLLQ